MDYPDRDQGTRRPRERYAAEAWPGPGADPTGPEATGYGQALSRRNPNRYAEEVDVDTSGFSTPPDDVRRRARWPTDDRAGEGWPQHTDTSTFDPVRETETWTGGVDPWGIQIDPPMPTPPTDPVAWRSTTQSAAWRSTTETASWRTTTESWRTTTERAAWRASGTSPEWEAGDNGAALRADRGVGLSPPAISATAWPTPGGTGSTGAAADGPDFAATQSRDAADTNGYPADPGRYGTDVSRHSADPGRYPADPGPYPADPGPYPADPGPYPADPGPASYGPVRPGYEPPSSQPSGYQPPAYEPSSYQSPAYEPSSYQSPASEPSSYQSPGSEPSSYQSPGYQAPGYRSPDYPSSSAYERGGAERGGAEPFGSPSPGYERPGYDPPGFESSGGYPPVTPDRSGRQSPGYEPTAYQPRSAGGQRTEDPPDFEQSIDQPSAYRPGGYEPPAYQPAAYEPPRYERTAHAEPAAYGASGYPGPDYDRPVAGEPDRGSTTLGGTGTPPRTGRRRAAEPDPPRPAAPAGRRPRPVDGESWADHTDTGFVPRQAGPDDGTRPRRRGGRVDPAGWSAPNGGYGGPGSVDTGFDSGRRPGDAWRPPDQPSEPWQRREDRSADAGRRPASAAERPVAQSWQDVTEVRGRYVPDAEPDTGRRPVDQQTERWREPEPQTGQVAAAAPWRDPGRDRRPAPEADRWREPEPGRRRLPEPDSRQDLDREQPATRALESQQGTQSERRREPEPDSRAAADSGRRGTPQAQRRRDAEPEGRREPAARRPAESEGWADADAETDRWPVIEADADRRPPGRGDGRPAERRPERRTDGADRTQTWRQPPDPSGWAVPPQGSRRPNRAAPGHDFPVHRPADESGFASEQVPRNEPGPRAAGAAPPAGPRAPGRQPAPPTSGVPMSGVPMSGVPMSGVPMSGVPMSGVPMSGVPMSGVPMSGVPMSGVPMSGVPMSGVPMSGIPMSGVPMSGVPMSGVPLSGAPVSGYPDDREPRGRLDDRPSAAPRRTGRPEYGGWSNDLSAGRPRQQLLQRADTDERPRGGSTYTRRSESTYSARAGREMQATAARQRPSAVAYDELYEDSAPGGPLAAMAYTLGCYGVPVLLTGIYILFLESDQQTRAVSTLASAAPQFLASLLLSLLVAVGLRRVSGAWKSPSVGVAAAVMGGGLATVLTSAITGQALG